MPSNKLQLSKDGGKVDLRLSKKHIKNPNIEGVFETDDFPIGMNIPMGEYPWYIPNTENPHFTTGGENFVEAELSDEQIAYYKSLGYRIEEM